MISKTGYSTYDLTKSQLMLWTGQELNPATPLYNMALTFDIEGSINPDVFGKSFHKLVEYCDAMRLTFAVKHGEPFQKLNQEVPYQFEYLDWSQEAKPLVRSGQWVQENSRRKLDLSRCAFHSALIRLHPNRHIWFLNQHHLITDAWSVSIQYRTMAAIYQSLINEQSLPRRLPLYSSYIAHESKIRKEQANAEAERYWQDQLSITPELPKLYGHSQPVFGTTTTRVTLDLGKERSDRLRALTLEEDLKAWTQHLSLYNIFATVLSVYLFRVTAQDRISFGTPAHNRSTLPFKSTAGLFIELYPIICKLAPAQTFQSVFRDLQERIHEFLKNAKPGVASANLNRSFHVILNYIHAEFSDFNGLPVKSTWIHPGHCDPRHYLRVQVHDFDASGSIEVNFDLNHEVFGAQQFGNISQHFLALLDAFIENRRQTIDRPPILAPEEKRVLTEDFNGTYAPESAALMKQFSSACHDYRDRTAIEWNDQRMTFGQLEQESNRMAEYLMHLGIAKGSVVVVNLYRSIDYFVAVWGILKRGAIFIPLASNTPVNRLKHIIADVEASLVITDSVAAGHWSALRTGIVTDFRNKLVQYSPGKTNVNIHSADPAYIIYTSGSTGSPKGVVVSHGALVNYLASSKSIYLENDRQQQPPVFPFFTNISFDLTITSVFLPILTGGKVIVYQEPKVGPDLTLLSVVRENKINAIKLTPAHLALLKGQSFAASNVKLLIVGGENLKSPDAKSALQSFTNAPVLFNEYGPTEATVGCIVHQYQVADLESPSVPIGKPIQNMRAYVLNSGLNLQPVGTTGELYLAGAGLANGYWNIPDDNSFIDDPFYPGTKMYGTGDLVFMNNRHELVFLGRKDEQIQIGGARVELGEIESQISQHPRIDQCVVDVDLGGETVDSPERYCSKCGIPSNYPGIIFDQEGVCDLCLSFEQYKQKTGAYFKRKDELRTLLSSVSLDESREYHCIMLLSGGKDSTYALSQLVEMDIKVLAFTLDNGYISDQAKSNIQRVVNALGVDHVFGETRAMNEIFVDSLERFSNVCNGCFKTIYTLSTNLAVTKNIPFIVTGLSRGQFFETRLTEELFRKETIGPEEIDQTILEARKIYHRTEDAVNRLLDVSVFQNDRVFDKVRFVDFYRFCDVSMDEMMQHLDQKLPWVRPTDTGRSTNCLINQAGIYIHKKERGYSNYAFPYSWDVRMGHKTRETSMEEINEEIDEQQVHKILTEIGYDPVAAHPQQKQLVAYYQSDKPISKKEILDHLSKLLPDYMIPSKYVQLEEFPLTANGKVDRKLLKKTGSERKAEHSSKPPVTMIEKKIHSIWSEVLNTDEFGIDEEFIQVGGNSLAAIRVMSRINEFFKLGLSLSSIFEFSTIESFSGYVEETIKQLIGPQT